MKQIMAMLRLDSQLILRDKVIWYVLISPAIMAVILILVSGKIGDPTPTFAVMNDVPQDISKALEKVARIDPVQKKTDLYQRVKAFDNVVGIFWENEVTQVVYQGNEGEAYVDQTATLIEAALNKKIPEIIVKNATSSKDSIVRIVMAALLLAPTLIGGTVSGFLIVADKEFKLIQGYRIAPIPFNYYMGARSILAAVIGCISMTILCVIFGLWEEGGALAIVILCTFPLFGVITLLIGSIAQDKVSSIAVFKILVLVFLVLPLASAFVPNRLHVIFYPVPMYWQFQSIRQILSNEWQGSYGMMTLISSLAMLIVVTIVFRNRMKKI